MKKTTNDDEQEYLTTRQAAEIFGLSRRTLEGYRATGQGPAFHRSGRRVCYARTDLDRWAKAHPRRSTAADGKGHGADAS